jgi:hypothetical protein
MLSTSSFNLMWQKYEAVTVFGRIPFLPTTPLVGNPCNGINAEKVAARCRGDMVNLARRDAASRAAYFHLTTVHKGDLHFP